MDSFIFKACAIITSNIGSTLQGDDFPERQNALLRRICSVVDVDLMPMLIFCAAFLVVVR